MISGMLPLLQYVALLTVVHPREVLKVAVTFAAAVIDTVQVPVPEQAPDQPAKVEPDAAVAVRVTLVPEANDAEHVAPQLMPAGLDATDPLPLPAMATFRGYCPVAQAPPGKVLPVPNRPLRQ